MPRAQAARRPRHQRRDVGIIRVSDVGDRSGESFISPTDQKRRLDEFSADDGAVLIATFEELNVSAGLPLHKRPGVLRAVEMVERDEADAVVFAYFDRSFRNTIVQMSTLERIWEAGGTTYAVGYGEIRIDTAAAWFATIVQGAANELVKRQTSEKVRNAKAVSVERGVPPYPTIARGYRRTNANRLELHPDEAPHLKKAFAMRADGATIESCQRYLHDNGVVISYAALGNLFGSRFVLGELRAGDLVNVDAHPALVDLVTFERVQRVKVPRGRQPLSEARLLTKQGGLLRCGTCGKGMSSSSTKASGRNYRYYTCSRKPECAYPTSISATRAELLVAEECQRWLADRAKSASIDAEVRAAEDDIEEKRAALDSAVLAFKGIDAASVNQRLRELQGDLDEAIDRLSRLLSSAGPAESISAGKDWDRLTFDEQRALIRAVFKAIYVAPSTNRFGGTLETTRARLTFEPFVE